MWYELHSDYSDEEMYLYHLAEVGYNVNTTYMDIDNGGGNVTYISSEVEISNEEEMNKVIDLIRNHYSNIEVTVIGKYIDINRISEADYWERIIKDKFF